jgi:cob(I)alamin adenosyltransferase
VDFTKIRRLPAVHELRDRPLTIHDSRFTIHESTNRPMKIYTRTGDDGSTSLFSGGRVAKSHPRVETYGAIDELNSALGAARAAAPAPPVEAILADLQHQLFKLGADLATPGEGAHPHIARVSAEEVSQLESGIDRMDAQLPPLKNFILPGGSPAAAQIHVARSICRRAERLAVLLAASDPINPAALVFLNRLSDFLFTLARFENVLKGVSETVWK